MFNAAFTDLLLVTLAVILVVAAVIDVRTFTISNRLNLTVALLAPVYWASVALSPWPGVAVQLAAGATVFVLLAGAFYAGMMGGGDVKLAAALERGPTEDSVRRCNSLRGSRHSHPTVS
jgi:prepilin peptidase CpaA